MLHSCPAPQTSDPSPASRPGHIIGRALGRPLRWRELTREEARQRLLADESFPDSFVDVLLDGYAKMFDEPAPTLTQTVQTVTGASARTFHQWALDHAEKFAPYAAEAAEVVRRAQRHSE